uniref:Uncharacterized protein n=1 Tax=Salix viminalis TaxID=40686 RepID=A0A6N2KYR8_SALVM
MHFYTLVVQWHNQICLSSFMWIQNRLFNWERVPQLLVSSSISLKPPNITYIDMEKAVVEDKRQEYVLESSLKCSPTEENKNSISCALKQSPPRDLHGRDC